MRKTFIKAVSLFAVICLLCPCFTPAYANTRDAAEGNKNTRMIPGDTELDDPVIWDDGASNWVEIFSIRAARVTDLLASKNSAYGNKSFRLRDLPSDATTIICEVKLNHSLEGVTLRQDGYVQYGVCYWGYDYIAGEDRFIDAYGNDLRTEQLGETVRVAFLIDDYLDNTKTYYAYVKNHYGYDGDDSTDDGGYVYGTMTLYYY